MSTEKATTISYRAGMALLKKEEDRQREAWFVWKAECQKRGEWPPTDEALEKHQEEVGTEVRLGKPQHPLPRPPPLTVVEAIEFDWSRSIKSLEEAIAHTEGRIDRLRVSPIAETSSPEHRAALLESLRDGIIKTREQIEDREANMRAKAIGPCPVLDELFGVYDTHDEAFDVLYEWFDAVWALPKTQREAMLSQAEDAQRGVSPDDIISSSDDRGYTERELSCGPPGHDYTDHLVVYEGQAILDINLPEGAKGRPLTGPSWTEVDPEKWSNHYKGERKKWDFNDAISGSFADALWKHAMWKAATLAEVAQN